MNITYTLAILISVLSKVITVNPLCNIVTYTSSDESKWKGFSSLKQSDGSKNCSLYKFRARSNLIVHLIFAHFDVGKHGRCSEGDHVNVYLHSSSGRISNETLPSGSLCGTLDEIPQVLYSSESNLILAQYTTNNQSKLSPWFNGTYRFISNSEFTKGGVSARGSDCEYEYSSDKSSKRSGTFSSPSYPSGYKANETCLYLFRANVGERVKLVFKEVNLREGDESCLERGDIIRVFEGRNLNNTALTRVLCNKAREIEYISSTPNVIVQLQASGTDWPPHSFTAVYTFIIPSTAQARTQLEKVADSHTGTSNNLTDETCGLKITSDEGGGNLSLSKYLPPTCKYEFEARGATRVKIKFSNFCEAKTVTCSADQCAGVQQMTALIWSEGHQDEVARFCNHQIPSGVMSNGPRLALVIDSMNKSSNNSEWDLKAQYSFLYNFGVNTGRQLAGFECGFIYTAEDWPTGGYFTSPNYPGLYPRDTECHYFFQGLDWQRVKVTFIHVDIDGTPPLCNYKTDSDYLEFSNCLFSDGTLPRKCGRNNFTMISNKKYFHVTFKSNSKLDATGFNATFRFFNDQTFLMTTIDKSSVSPNMIWCMTRTFLKLILLFFLLN